MDGFHWKNDNDEGGEMGRGKQEEEDGRGGPKLEHEDLASNVKSTGDVVCNNNPIPSHERIHEEVDTRVKLDVQSLDLRSAAGRFNSDS
jgi:hypothetical protein